MGREIRTFEKVVKRVFTLAGIGGGDKVEEALGERVTVPIINKHYVTKLCMNFIEKVYCRS